jgi:hypothetical protein
MYLGTTSVPRYNICTTDRTVDFTVHFHTHAGGEDITLIYMFVANLIVEAR